MACSNSVTELLPYCCQIFPIFSVIYYGYVVTAEPAARRDGADPDGESVFYWSVPAAVD